MKLRLTKPLAIWLIESMQADFEEGAADMETDAQDLAPYQDCANSLGIVTYLKDSIATKPLQWEMDLTVDTLGFRNRDLLLDKAEDVLLAMGGYFREHKIMLDHLSPGDRRSSIMLAVKESIQLGRILDLMVIGNKEKEAQRVTEKSQFSDAAYVVLCLFDEMDK